MAAEIDYLSDLLFKIILGYAVIVAALAIAFGEKGLAVEVYRWAKAKYRSHK